jgi:DHA1 family bicyclomycin/chloramphenicol resistance-like MFS transporter
VTKRDAVPWGMATLLAAMGMVSPFTIDTFFPSFRAITAEFSLSDWQIQQTLTLYMIPFAIMSLLHGPVSDAVGRRPVVLTGLSLYAASSILGTLAPNFATLIACRILQGASAGVGMVVGRAVIRDLYHGAQAQRLMNAMTLIFGVAPAIAPVIGGWLHVAFGWRSIFGFMTLYGVVLVAACWKALPETHPPARRVVVSFGELASSLWLVFRDRRFLMLAIASSVMFGAIMGFIGSAPYIVLDEWKLKETQFIYLFLPVITGFTGGAFLSSRLAGRWPERRQVSLGYGLIITGAAMLLVLQASWPSSPIPLQQLLITFMTGGVQLVFPVLTLQMLDLFPKHRGTVASAQSFVSLVYAAIIVGVLVPLVHGSLLKLSAAALAGVVTGFLCWRAARVGVHHGAKAPQAD